MKKYKCVSVLYNFRNVHAVFHNVCQKDNVHAHTERKQQQLQQQKIIN